jgi:hypothetical protein
VFIKHEVDMILRIAICALCTLLSFSELIAQQTDSLAGLQLNSRPEGKGWFIEVSPGYGIPFLATRLQSPLVEIGDRDLFQRGQRELSVESIFGTVGGGFNANVTIGHMFNKYIGVDGNINFAQHPRRLDSRIDQNGYFASQYTGTNAFYFAPHLVMRWNNDKRFGVTGRVGPLLPFYGSPISDILIRDREGRLLQTLTGGAVIPIPGNIVDVTLRAKTITRFNPTIGLSASIAMEYKATDNIWVFAQMRVAAYTVELKETEFLEASMSTKILGIEVEELGPLRVSFQDVNDAPEFLRLIKYRRELNLESNTGRYGGRVDFDQPMDELSIRYNPTSLFLNIGVRFNINRWENGRGEKKMAKKAPKD